jgi:uncharacterized protein (TIGR02466 family)
MNLSYVFSSFVVSDTLTSIDNAELKKYAYDVKKSSPGVVRSNFYGWQSGALIKPNPEIQKLVNEILSRAESVKTECGLKSSARTFINHLWININPKSGFNRPHIHTDCVMSGAYYVSVGPKKGDILFKNPASNLQYHLQDQFVDNYNSVSSANWTITPKEGQLLLFPAWLEHYVEPNLNDEDRISISFNIAVK